MRFSLSLAVLTALITLSHTLFAQDEAAGENFQALLDRRQEIANRLGELRDEFAKAEGDKKVTIRDEFARLVDEFENGLQDKLIAAAETAEKENPGNKSAAEFLMHSTFENNEYTRAAKYAESLLDEESPNGYAYNIAGAAHFAQHNFARAVEILEAAEKNGTLNAMVGGRYLSAAREYQDFWKTEQAKREEESEADEADQLPHVVLQTSRGDITLELFENQAPNTVANFIQLVEDGVYDGTKFHRVIANFMIQGGDPNSKDDDTSDDGFGGPGHTIKCECYREDARRHFRGSLSMAHSGRDTGGSQFFITHLPTAHLNGLHTVFGRVIEGLDLAMSIKKGDSLKSAKVIRKRDHEYKAERKKDEDSA